MNVITIAGNLGRDAELKTTQAGDSVLGFSIADQGRKDTPPIWWRCSLWGRRAEALAQYLTKGTQLTVVGEVSQRRYVNKDGQEQSVMEVRVHDLKLQGGRQEQRQEQRQVPSQPVPVSFDDDDIPF